MSSCHSARLAWQYSGVASSAAITGEGGDRIEADREVAWLDQNQPDLVKNMRQMVSTRLARSQDVELIIGSLRKAGLDIKGWPQRSNPQLLRLMRDRIAAPSKP
ncbi:hypothetical protein B5V02_11470 [Mesorhizobium kowhaii]|uniref:Uncharacterized protein n=2 Tax=Mesorhizobium kowhaii TaxID=1300272 RepID=A0A2W7CWX4_9HYPH|nr:hypothetical protein B5V02_11470 [Mesorhizobium kowhaii]